MKRLVLILAIIVSPLLLLAAAYQPGDKATDFKLKNVDGNFVSLKDFPEAKGFIVIFTCNTCPYARAYQDRIIELDKKYRKMQFPVIAINPNDPEVQAGDSYEKMIERSNEKNFTFPYLFDETQEVYRSYGATRTPEVYVLIKKGNELIVSYTGAIDDNYKDAARVETHYLSDAIDKLLAGETPDPATTKAIGCSIKTK